MQVKRIVQFVCLLLALCLLVNPCCATTNLKAGAVMWKDGAFETIRGLSDEMVSDARVSAGDVNTTGNFSGETVEPEEINFERYNVPVFGVTLHRIDVLENEEVKKSTEWTKPAFQYFAVLFLLVVAFFAILQAKKPAAALSMTRHMFGHARVFTWVDIKDYTMSISFWYLLGPFLLLAGVWLANYLLSGIDTSPIDQIEIGSDNVTQYFVIGVCAQILKYFFAIRNVILIYSAIMWYFIGLIIAFPRTRFVGILYMGYVYVLLLIQPMLVSMLSFLVKFIEFGGFSYMADLLLYGGLAIIEAALCVAAATVIIWFPKYCPSYSNRVYWYARSLENYGI